MIRNLGNISIRLWLCTMAGIPLSFSTLSVLSPVFPDLSSLYTGILIHICLFWLSGLLMNYIGKSLIWSAIREGEAWERSGIPVKSEQSYIKALRIYDTFLLSYFASKKAAPRLIHALARFILTTRRNQPNFMNAATVYLKNRPEDEDLALLWLKRMSGEEKMNAAQEDVLAGIAQVHAGSPRILPLLTRFFIGLKRKDFPAQKIYQSALEDMALKPHFESRINDIVGSEEDILGSKRPVIPFEPRTEKAHRPIKPILIKYGHLLMSFFKTLAGLLTSGISFLLLSLYSVIHYIKERDSAGFYLKTGILTATGVFLAVLAINTISHLIPSPSSPPEKPTLEIQVPQPFTIQVAAYLKKLHADQYVERLKKQGLDVESKTVFGGGKEWFLVTVSAFPDKTSAARYGRDLKDRGIIEDFFVTNRL